MRNKKGKLCCDICKKEIEELDEEEALADMEGHGWVDVKTAHEFLCYHCLERQHPSIIAYETYFAGRIRIRDGKKQILVGRGDYFER